MQYRRRNAVVVPGPRRARVVGALPLLLAGAALGNTQHWTAGSGIYSVGSNWNNGAGPFAGLNDEATFDSFTSNYTVSFTNTPTNALLTVKNGSVNFQATSSPRTYTMTGATTISNGGFLNLQTNGSVGAPLFTLALSTLTINDGTLRMTDGSGATATGTISVGTGGVGVSAITVVSGSALTQTSGAAVPAMTLGAANGTAILLIDGGTVSTGQGAITVNPSGIIELGGTFNCNGNITFDDGALTTATGSAFNLAAGKTIDVKNNGTMMFVDGTGLGGGSTLTLESGGKLSATHWYDIGNGSAGTVVVQDTGSTYTIGDVTYWGALGGTATVTVKSGGTVTATSELYVGLVADANAANATLNVQTGGVMNLQTLHVGFVQGPGTVNAAMTVTGAGATVTQSGASVLDIGGATGSATLSVLDSGVFTSGTGAISINKSGTLLIDGGTFNANGSITVDGGHLTWNSGTFSLAAGKTFTAQSNAVVHFGSDHFIDSGKTFTIQSGTQMDVSGFLDVGSGSNGTLIVDGGTTLLHITSYPFWGYNGGKATVTIRQGATVTIDSDLDVGLTTSPGSNGLVSVETGGSLTVGNLAIARDASPNDVRGEVDVAGMGSFVTLRGGSSLTVGASDNHVGTLFVDDHATFTTGTGPIAINATGEVIISNNGVFHAKGDVTVTGGELSGLSDGAIDLAAGKNLTAQSGGHVFITGGSGIQGGSTYTIQSAASFFSNSYVDVGTGAGSVGTLIVDGMSTKFTASGEPFWGGAGGDAHVTIRLFAAATISSTLDIGIPGGGSSTVRVENGATMSVGDLKIGVGGDTTSSLTVVGMGAKVTQTGGAALTIGANPSMGMMAINAAGGIFTTAARGTVGQPTGGRIISGGAGGLPFQATVNIDNGGIFTTGTGPINVLGTGQLIVQNGGIFNANGDITNNGNITLAGTANFAGNFTSTGGGATLGGTQTWTSGKQLTVAGGIVSLIRDPGGASAYNLVVGVTPPTGTDATLHVSSNTTSDHLRDLKVNAVGAQGSGLLIIDPAAPNAAGHPATHFGAPGGSTAVYIGNGAGGNGVALRASIENLWRSAALEGYWALRNGSVSAVTRGVTLAPGIVVNSTLNGLVILPSVDEDNHVVTYLGEDINGDTNGDGKVDVNDVGVVLQHLNTNPGAVVGETGYTIYTPAEGDVNGDLKTDVNDLTVVLADLNLTYTPAAASGGVQNVPEPVGCVLLAAGVSVLGVRRRRGSLPSFSCIAGAGC